GRNLTTGHHPAARRLEVVLSTRETQSGKGIKGLTQQRMPQVQQYGVRRRAEYWSTIEVMDKEAVIEHQPGHGAADTLLGWQSQAVIHHCLPAAGQRRAQAHAALGIGAIEHLAGRTEPHGNAQSVLE